MNLNPLFQTDSEGRYIDRVRPANTWALHPDTQIWGVPRFAQQEIINLSGRYVFSLDAVQRTFQDYPDLVCLKLIRENYDCVVERSKVYP